MRCALRLNDMNLIREIFLESGKVKTGSRNYGPAIQRQLAYLLGRQNIVFPDEECLADEELTEMLWNIRLSEHFLSLGRELDIMDPKVSIIHICITIIVLLITCYYFFPHSCLLY